MCVFVYIGNWNDGYEFHKEKKENSTKTINIFAFFVQQKNS